MLGGRRWKREHGVVGDTANLAARLEGKAAAGQVVIGAGTYERLGDGAVVEPLRARPQAQGAAGGRVRAPHLGAERGDDDVDA